MCFSPTPEAFDDIWQIHGISDFSQLHIPEPCVGLFEDKTSRDTTAHMVRKSSSGKFLSFEPFLGVYLLNLLCSLTPIYCYPLWLLHLMMSKAKSVLRIKHSKYPDQKFQRTYLCTDDLWSAMHTFTHFFTASSSFFFFIWGGYVDRVRLNNKKCLQKNARK